MTESCSHNQVSHNFANSTEQKHGSSLCICTYLHSCDSKPCHTRADDRHEPSCPKLQRPAIPQHANNNGRHREDRCRQPKFRFWLVLVPPRQLVHDSVVGGSESDRGKDEARSKTKIEATSLSGGHMIHGLEEPAHFSEEDIEYANDEEDKATAEKDNGRLGEKQKWSAECSLKLETKRLSFIRPWYDTVAATIEGALECSCMRFSQYDKRQRQCDTSLYLNSVRRRKTYPRIDERQYIPKCTQSRTPTSKLNSSQLSHPLVVQLQR